MRRHQVIFQAFMHCVPDMFLVYIPYVTFWYILMLGMLCNMVQDY